MMATSVIFEVVMPTEFFIGRVELIFKISISAAYEMFTCISCFVIHAYVQQCRFAGFAMRMSSSIVCRMPTNNLKPRPLNASGR